MADCGSCGEVNPEKARFCLACGSELGSPATQTRKTVSVLFADIVGSTALAEGLDPEAYRSLIHSRFVEVERTIERYGGRVEKFIGDAVMAVFGVPMAHEDDPMRAICAASAIQKTLLERDEEPIEMRIAVNTGEVVTSAESGGRTGVVGDPVNIAARLEKLAPPGGIVFSGETFRFVRDRVNCESLGPKHLTGKADPVNAYLLLAVDPIPPQERTYDAPMVGRTWELAALQHALDRVIRDRTCMIVSILGPAGIGKSRLISELFARAEDPPRVLSGRCLPYGDGITFWPLTETISEAAHISDRDSAEDAIDKLRSLMGPSDDAKLIAGVMSQLLGLSQPTAGQEEIFWAVRRFYETLADETPLVLVFDDIHWGEETFLDLVDHLAENTSDLPLLIICMARPELLETRPSWGGGKLNAMTMLIEPLGAGETKELFAGLLGDTSAVEPLMPAILESAEGNPYFLEETIAMLAEDKVIENVEGRWILRGDVSDIAIPPTIHSLLTARLDQLPAQERAALELAALMGKVFSSQAVKDLSEPGVDAKEPLEELTRKGIIRLDQEEFAGEEMFRFRHLLMRDAAYYGLPKQRRADLHQRYADWLVHILGERTPEYEEIIGYHLESSVAYQEELGVSGDIIDETRRKAADRLAAAGKRAADRGDDHAAVSLLQRATHLLDPADPLRLEVGIQWAAALIDDGDFVSAETLLLELIDQAKTNGDRRAEAYARLQLEESRMHLQPQFSAERSLEVGQEAVKTFEELGDDIGQAHGLRLMAYAWDTLGNSTEARECYERALHHAEASGDRGRAIQYRRFLMQSISWGPITADDLLPLAEDFLQWSLDHSDLRSEAQASGILSYAHAMKGDFELAQRHSDRREAILQELNLELLQAWSVFESSAIHVLQGNWTEAERLLRRSCEICERKSERAVFPTIVALLADVLLEIGELDEAAEMTQKAQELGAEDDFITQVKWRSVRAKLLALSGECDSAESLAREAVDLAARTDYVDWQANATSDLAKVLLQCKKTTEAKTVLDGAEALYEAKGFTVGVEKTRALRASLEA